LVNKRGESRFKFDAFKTFCERVVSVIGSFVADGISKAYRALKYLGCLFGNKNTFRMSLTCLSVFSLSAQTPRQDSGGDGLYYANVTC